MNQLESVQSRIPDERLISMKSLLFSPMIELFSSVERENYIRQKKHSNDS